LAIFLAAAVVCFAFQAAGHWHNNSFEDQHCRICHFAHSAVVDLSQSAVLEVPAVVQRFSSNFDIDPALDVVFHPLSSRAPPA
jgi:hypothetical protein